MTAAFLLAGLLALGPTSAWAQGWPQWRGPTGDGISQSSSAPITWSPLEGVRWKAVLAGQGTSSPIVAGGRVFITGQRGANPIDHRGAQFPGSRPATLAPRDTDDVLLVVQALDLRNGESIWTHEFAAEAPLPAVHRNHSWATPSIVTDGHAVFAWFGTGQLVALGLDGRLLWERHLGRDYGPFDLLWGHGSSPVLYGDLIVLQCDHPPDGYLPALDVETGRERWRIDRAAAGRSYGTPVIITHDRRDELIVNSGRRIDAFDPRTGAALWHAGRPVELGVGMPVYRRGILYSARGYSSSPYLAVAMGGAGDVSETHIQWRNATGAPYISSLLFHDDLLYMANENGILTVIDATSGDVVSRGRLGGVFTASPIFAAGHIYFLNEGGETIVLRPGPEPEIVARNALGERSLASPAAVDGKILIRTDQSLYCLE